MITKIENLSKDDIFYKVGYKENAETISKKFNITEKDLKIDNYEEIIEGDYLYIPFKNSAVHIVKPTETLEQIAKMHNVSVNHIKKKNNIEMIFVGMKLYI